MGQVRQTVLGIAGREVVITNPDKVIFPEAGHTKLDLVKYYAAVAEAALRGIAARPLVLKRYVNGAEREPFFQKRAPEQRPEWVETVELRFPSGRTAREIVVRDPAQLLWIVNLGCIDLNPHPVRADDLEHPDELRVDLDPGPGTSWDDVRRVALIVRDVLDEHRLRGWPKTSGSRGMHIYVRIHRRWSFDQVRRATLALAREVERRAPGQAASRRASLHHAGRARTPRRKGAAAGSRPNPSSRSPRQRTKRTRSPASNGGRHAIRRLRRGSRSTTCSSTRCAAAHPRGRGSGSTCAMSPKASGLPRNRPIPTTIPGAARSRGGPGSGRRRPARARRGA